MTRPPRRADQRRCRRGTAGAAAGLLAAVLLWPERAVAADACSPPGPPYRPACVASQYYYFHGNQLETTANAAATIEQAPWRHVGLVTTAAGQGTGTLIAPDLVLTAAHVVHDGNRFKDDIGFALAVHGQRCSPYAASGIGRAWVPQEWLDNVGGDVDAPASRAYDWAVLRVGVERRVAGAPPAAPMRLGLVREAAELEGLRAGTVGYACGRSASGSARQARRLYGVLDQSPFDGLEIFPAIGARGGGGLLRTSVEATRGMSGGPLFVRTLFGPVLVGVLLGSPQAACNAGEMWAAAITPRTRSRIQRLIDRGSAPGMVELQPLSGFFSSPFCTTFP